MIQRYLYTALSAGLEVINKNPKILDGLFSDLYGLGKTELDAIRKWFVENPPMVMHGYARTDAKFPLYSITLQSEGEDKMMLGDEADQVMDSEDPDDGADTYAAMWQHNYGILCYSKHPDGTMYLYEVAKAIILQAHDYLVAQDIWGIRISGMDVHPDPRYIPEYLFVRQLTFACESEFKQVAKGSKFGKAFAVDGIFVDSSGSPHDVGEVKTLVTTYTPDGSE